jgi:hypothetical protein
MPPQKPPTLSHARNAVPRRGASLNRSHFSIDRDAEVAQAFGVQQKHQDNDRVPAATDCEQFSFPFQDLGARKVVADFSGGRVSNDAGALLLRELDASIGLTRGLAKCFRDRRHPVFIEHTLEELLAQRVQALVLGYEDLNDHARLRHDPLLAVAAGKTEPLGGPAQDEPTLAAPATLNRLETTVDHAGSRYHKIDPDTDALRAYLLRRAMRTLDKDEREVVIDLDATHDPLHGEQEGRFFHGHYDCYCYLPLYAFIGQALCWAQLRPADAPLRADAVAALAQIVPAVRARCPHARIIVRGDSGFGGEEVAVWCEAHGVDYVLGLERNARLQQLLTPAMDHARARACLVGGYTRVYAQFDYQTLRSWSRARRVVGKAEVLGDKANPRYVMTSLPDDGERFAPRALYEQTYCGRGNMELRIKEQQLDLFADRLSCHGFASNQLRLWLAAFAYVLAERLRAIGLRGTSLATATVGTIRTRLLKIGALFELSVRRVRVRLNSAFPWRELFAQVWRQIRACPIESG